MQIAIDIVLWVQCFLWKEIPTISTKTFPPELIPHKANILRQRGQRIRNDLQNARYNMSMFRRDKLSKIQLASEITCKRPHVNGQKGQAQIDSERFIFCHVWLSMGIKALIYSQSPEIWNKTACIKSIRRDKHRL